MTTLPVHSRTRVLFTLLFALLLPATEARGQQATLDGNVIDIPVVTVGDQFYEVKLGITPDTNPPEFDLVEGYEVSNKESEVENSSGVNGIWSITETVNAQQCGLDDPYTERYDLDVFREGDTLTVISETGTYTGTINGTSLVWSGKYPEEGGELTTTATVTFTPDLNSITGTASWTLTVEEESCSGTSTLSGKLVKPDSNPIYKIDSADPSMPGLVTIVDDGASSFQDNVLHIPAITVNDVNFWADLELISGDPIRFRLKDAGESDVHLGLSFNHQEDVIDGAVIFGNSYGRAEVTFDPYTGLLYDLIVGDEYFIFFNYTDTTVDLARLAIGEETLYIPDIPLSDESIAYIQEILAEPEPDNSQAELKLPGVFSRSQALRVELTDEEKEVQKKLEKARKALEISLDVMEKAVKGPSYTVGQASVDVLKELTKDLRYELLGYEIGEDSAQQVKKFFEIAEAGITRISCMALNPWSCAKYYLKKEEIDKTLDSFYDTIKDEMAEAQQKVTDAHELSVARKVGCDTWFDSNPQKRAQCNGTLGDASGQLEETLEPDRDGDGTDDVNQDQKDLETIRRLRETTEAIAAAKEASGEDVSSCTVGFKANEDGSEKHYLDTNPESWWFGCFNTQEKKTGVWTQYWHETGKWQTKSFKNGVLDGPASSYYETSPTINEGNSFTGEYKNGQTHGTWITYFKKAVVLTQTYNEGVLHGPYSNYPTPYYDYGESGQYTNGKKDGIWFIYADNKLYSINTYSNGDLIKTERQ